MLKRKKKSELSQVDVFKEIWMEREHVCRECGRYLSDPPSPSNFSHYLPKSIYPKLKLVKENIDLLCLQHHYQWDFGDKFKMKIYDDDRIQSLKELDRLIGISGSLPLTQ